MTGGRPQAGRVMAKKPLPATAAVGYNLLVVRHLQFAAQPAAAAPAARVGFIDYNLSILTSAGRQ